MFAMRSLSSARRSDFTWSVFLEAASARPRASPARASAESAFSAAALILGSSLSNCFWVFCACLSTSLTFAVIGSVFWATYFFVAQPPNSSTTLAMIVASMTRFMGIPPFEFELDSRCYSSIALGRAEAGWTLRGATWRGGRATGTIEPNLTVNPSNLPLSFRPRRRAVPQRQPTSKPDNLLSFLYLLFELSRHISANASVASFLYYCAADVAPVMRNLYHAVPAGYSTSRI